MRRLSTHVSWIVGLVGIACLAVNLSDVLPRRVVKAAPTAADARKLSVTFREVAHEVLPSIVAIETRGKAAAMNGLDPDDEENPLNDLFKQNPQFREFFKERPKQRETPKARGMGSGFIIDESGVVLTNSHVVRGADEVKVRLHDGHDYVATDISMDDHSDIAVLKIKGAKGLKALRFGDSDTAEIGDWVLAVGNPFDVGMTVTAGIISAKSRGLGIARREDFLQTDAAINPGNSGGPLFNLKGEVVGIPTMIRAGAQGIGFAVPVNALRDILPQLRDKGVVTRGKLGVRIQPLTPDLAKGLGLERPRGALIAGVEPGGSAARAGLLSGDVITAVDGQEVPRSDDLPRLVARHTPGSKIKLAYVRAGAKKELDATLDSLAPEGDDEDETAPPRTPVAPPPAPTSKLGVTFDNGGTAGGAKVRGVAPESAAAGQLAPGDVIVELDRQPVHTTEELAKKVDAMAPGRVVLLKVKRGPDSTRFVAITLGGVGSR